ncbi:MAG: YceI family protein [Chloroflexi bacterium]|nr:YceI family protein [Chloroflexota bacterium]
MKKRVMSLFILSIAAVWLSACGLMQEPAAPSATLEAIPLEIATAVPTTAPLTAAEPTAVPSDAAYPAGGADTAAAALPPADAAPSDSAYPAPSSGGVRVYTIASGGESQVSFELDEDLRGSRITVVGTTDQVAGQLGVDLADLSSAQVGVLQINARTLATDNDFRNRAIQNEILNTGAYEFITFTPTAVNGLSASANIGEAITFTIVGDLTIRDVTQSATFTVMATAVSETQLTGTATAVISRADYNLNIPSVPNVANVEEEVQLTIRFTANAS